MLADTSFIIDLMAGVPAAVAKAAEFEKKGLAVWVGAPTVFELYVGLSLTIRPGEELERIIGVIGSLPQLALDHVAAARRAWSTARSGGKGSCWTRRTR